MSTFVGIHLPAKVAGSVLASSVTPCWWSEASCCMSLLVWHRGQTPPPTLGSGAVSSPGSCHFWPDPCQILCVCGGGGQMGSPFYVLIKEEFAPSQTRHLWPGCLVAFIIHRQRGEVSCHKGFREEWKMSGGWWWWCRCDGGGWSSVSAASFIPVFNCLSISTWRRQISCNISSKQQRLVSWLYCLSSHTSRILCFCPVWGANHLGGIVSRMAGV